jgi:hypothetical protein
MMARDDGAAADHAAGSAASLDGIPLIVSELAAHDSSPRFAGLNGLVGLRAKVALAAKRTSTRRQTAGSVENGANSGPSNAGI